MGLAWSSYPYSTRRRPGLREIHRRAASRGRPRTGSKWCRGGHLCGHRAIFEVLASQKGTELYRIRKEMHAKPHQLWDIMATDLARSRAECHWDQQYNKIVHITNGQHCSALFQRSHQRRDRRGSESLPGWGEERAGGLYVAQNHRQDSTGLRPQSTSGSREWWREAAGQRHRSHETNHERRHDEIRDGRYGVRDVQNQPYLANFVREGENRMNGQAGGEQSRFLDQPNQHYSR
ncbi:MAG: hypothetical protein LQ352_003733 [Teloschistes flavicans]|nr:MAG: hypothetical protein LQ352_003733 [Teloschistes flavicans]